MAHQGSGDYSKEVPESSENQLNFNLILKNGSHFTFDELKFYTCDKNNNSYLEFYYNMNLIYNLTNCPNEFQINDKKLHKMSLIFNLSLFHLH